MTCLGPPSGNPIKAGGRAQAPERKTRCWIRAPDLPRQPWRNTLTRGSPKAERAQPQRLKERSSPLTLLYGEVLTWVAGKSKPYVSWPQGYKLPPVLAPLNQPQNTFCQEKYFHLNYFYSNSCPTSKE